MALLLALRSQTRCLVVNFAAKVEQRRSDRLLLGSGLRAILLLILRLAGGECLIEFVLLLRGHFLVVCPPIFLMQLQKVVGRGLLDRLLADGHDGAGVELAASFCLLIEELLGFGRVRMHEL